MSARPGNTEPSLTQKTLISYSGVAVPMAAMGMVIDRFDTRWGRRKQWIAISIPVLLISVWMVFMPDKSAVSSSCLLFWLVLMYVGYTMPAIEHQSWAETS